MEPAPRAGSWTLRRAEVRREAATLCPSAPPGGEGPAGEAAPGRGAASSRKAAGTRGLAAPRARRTATGPELSPLCAEPTGLPPPLMALPASPSPLGDPRDPRARPSPAPPGRLSPPRLRHSAPTGTLPLAGAGTRAPQANHRPGWGAGRGGGGVSPHAHPTPAPPGSPGAERRAGARPTGWACPADPLLARLLSALGPGELDLGDHEDPVKQQQSHYVRFCLSFFLPIPETPGALKESDDACF